MKTNCVTLIGYVGSNLITRQLPNGSIRTALRIATHETHTNEQGQRKWQTTWHDVVAWNGTARYAGSNFVKGSRLMVEGCITYRTYPDTAGHIRYITLITAHSLLNLDR